MSKDTSLRPRRRTQITLSGRQTLRSLVKGGHYDHVDERLKKHVSLPSISSGRVILELVHLGYDTTSEEAEKELGRRGYRPATIQELLTLGAEFCIVRRFPIVSLQKFTRGNLAGNGVFIFSRKKQAILDVEPVPTRWGSRTRFLGVLK